MLINLINACNPAKKPSINNNVFYKIILRVVYSQENKLHLAQLGIKSYLMIAVEALHHPKLDKRLEGILELEKLAKAYPQYNWEIMEILTEFVRKHAPHITQENISSIKINADIQASLSVISRRDTEKYLESEPIDLSYTDLRGTNLSEANLAGANLYQVNLSGVNLAGANLSGTILSAANLSEANLAGANLSGAILSAANLSKTNLTKANLSRANLYLANLYQTNLQDAILDKANLRETKFSGQNTIDAE